MNQEKGEDKRTEVLISIINKLLLIVVVLVISIIAMPFVLIFTGDIGKPEKQEQQPTNAADTGNTDATIYWSAPDMNTIGDAKLKEQVIYGRELIEHTAKYFGPNGSVMKMSNGMNCQNCHLQAGTAVYGNNYGSVASIYPKFRARSGGVEDINKRVNDCFERSLNGKALSSESREMKAIVAYINFLGSNVAKGKKAEGSGLKELTWLDRAADQVKGLDVYTAKCQSCHQTNGDGLLDATKTEYIYPPLWGKNSFNDGAGLFRISNFAKYVKYNMPQGVNHLNTQLTDEEAWDVSAFVVSQQRPHINVPRDWPDISKKPIDHPFGPYIDSFSEKQHKFGPFKPIEEEQKKKQELVKQKQMSVVKK